MKWIKNRKEFSDVAKRLRDDQLFEEFSITGNTFESLQDLLANIESYLDVHPTHRTEEKSYTLLHYAKKVVRNAVEELEEDIVADVIASDNKTRD